MHVIALTGGPCAGKSSALARIRYFAILFLRITSLFDRTTFADPIIRRSLRRTSHLENLPRPFANNRHIEVDFFDVFIVHINHISYRDDLGELGYHVYTVPEAATILLSGGFAFSPLLPCPPVGNPICPDSLPKKSFAYINMILFLIRATIDLLIWYWYLVRATIDFDDKEKFLHFEKVLVETQMSLEVRFCSPLGFPDFLWYHRIFIILMILFRTGSRPSRWLQESSRWWCAIAASWTRQRTSRQSSSRRSSMPTTGASFS